MARIRTIKPEFWEDEKVSDLPYGCRLLFIGIWNFSDDNGVIKTSPKHLKAKIFPYDENLRETEIKKWMDALVKARMLIPISHGGESYYVVRTFRSHQVIDKRYARELLPIELVNKLTLDALSDNIKTHSDHIVTTTDSHVGKEGKGKEGKEDGETPPREQNQEEIEYEAICKWIKEKAPRVMQMKEPLTMEEYFKLKDRYPVDLIAKILMAMHNWGKLTKERVSAYLTFIAFAKKETSTT